MEELRIEANGNLGPIDSSRIPRYAGAATYARLPRLDQVAKADVTVVGVPFDSGVSYRPGARFGANHVREASRLLRPYNPAWDVSPFENIQVADAGDMAVNPFNINEAIETIQQNALDLTASGSKLLTLGGDHTIALPLLRAAAERAGGPIAMLHFDAHLDTWDTYFGAEYTHGTPFRRAVEEGILDTEAISHIGTRGPLYGKKDLDDDHRFGFGIVTSADVYYQGVLETVAKVRDRIGNRPLYISVDIDVLDPAHAPGTGTPEAGGITSRELLEIIRGFRGMNLVGADVVEVAPAYDHAEITGVAASHVAYELVTLMADNAVEGDRFGAATGYAAQALGQEALPAHRRPQGVQLIDFDPGTAAPTKGTGVRNGGDLVVETLEALGAKTVFGIPGQHALGLFDADGPRKPALRVLPRGEQQGLRRGRVLPRHRRGRRAVPVHRPGRADVPGRAAGGLRHRRAHGGCGQPDPARGSRRPPQGHAAPAR